MAARISAIISRYVWKLRGALRCGNRSRYGCDRLEVIGSIVGSEKVCGLGLVVYGRG
jgi:hypothetical protein